MSLVKGAKAKNGVGFDMAENILAQAKDNAAKTGIPCEFESCNALQIPEKYYDQFDCIIVMIGVLCWFDELKAFFEQIALCLKREGILIIQEIHPFTNMLSVEGEETFDKNNLAKIAWSYFKKEPFIYDSGMPYMTGKIYKSKIFTDFAHTMGDIIDSIIRNQLKLTSIQEYDYDVGFGVDELSGKGFPLSYILTAQKE
jgi:ubiquinone/menaquinone biosynthesis C-methylase UbiE